MSQNSRPPAGGRHGGGGRGPRPPQRQPLRDNYYYEEPPRGRGGQVREFEDISSSSPGRRRREVSRRTAASRKKEAAGARPSARQGRAYPAKRRGGWKKKILSVLLVLVVLAVAGGLYLFGAIFSGLTMTSIPKDKESLGIGPEAYSDPDVKNIALFGLDAREDENVGRSDALLVLTVDGKRRKLKLTSILRDSEVYIEGYGYDKITHAYAYGGPELAIKTLNQNFHLDIGDYVTVNFVEMARIVDAFGGVRVEIQLDEMVEINENLTMLMLESADADIDESDYLHETGEVLLNGNQAVAYARIRHLEGGDDVRAGRQQQVLQGLVRQLKGKSKLAYPALLAEILPLCETSLDFGGMLGLAPFAMGSFSMESLTIPGGEEGAYGDINSDGVWVYMYDTEAAAQHLSRFLYEEDSPYSW